MASELVRFAGLLLGHAPENGLHSTKISTSGVVVVHAGHDVLLLVQLLLLGVVLLRESGGKNSILSHGRWRCVGYRNLSLFRDVLGVVGQGGTF